MEERVGWVMSPGFVGKGSGALAARGVECPKSRRSAY